MKNNNALASCVGTGWSNPTHLLGNNEDLREGPSHALAQLVGSLHHYIREHHLFATMEVVLYVQLALVCVLGNAQAPIVVKK